MKRIVRFSIRCIRSAVKTERGNPGPRLTSSVYPVSIPLAPDTKIGWKPYPLFKGSTTTLHSLSCHISTLVKGHIPHPPHKHREEEILMLLSGGVDLFIQKGPATNECQRKRLTSGEFVYYPAYFAHTIQAVSDEPANYLMFRWHDISPKKGPSALRFSHFTFGGSQEATKVKDGFCLRLVFEGPTQYLKKLQCHTSALTSRAGYDPHSDPYDVSIIVLEGEVQTLGKCVSPHSVIFYAAGEPHGMFNPGETTARYIVFEFHGIPRSSIRDMHDFIVSQLRKLADLRAWNRKRLSLIKRIKGLTQPTNPFEAITAHSYVQPTSIGLDASTKCQLHCPACPRSTGSIDREVGSGFLSFDNFKKVIDKNPWVSEVELSNWGEIFLNPELKEIIRYAYQKQVHLSANNGANLNTVSDDVLEALVKYQFRSLSCSIDGASQETYATYRVGGDYQRVINAIKKINYFKQTYRSEFPKLRWQFVAFGHNEHEISTARALAYELNMSFYVKLSWDDLYTSAFSPIKNRELVKRETGLDAADRQEYETAYGKSYIDGICRQLWLCPHINYDGKLLGCTVNHWGNFGNVFEQGLETCLRSETLQYAKQMVLGQKKAQDGIPCSACPLYARRKKNNSWVLLEDLHRYAR